MRNMKNKSHIAFRTSGWSFAPVFLDAINRLKISESEFAKICIETGFTKAVAEIGTAQRRRQRTIAAARKRIIPFDWRAASDIAAECEKILCANGCN